MPQQEGLEELIRNPQQEEQSDTIEGIVIVDYNPDVDYEGSEPKVEPGTQEKRKVGSYVEYVKVEMPRDEILHQRIMLWEIYMAILLVHNA